VMSSLAQAYGYVDQFEEALDLLAQVAQYHQRHNAPVEYQFTRLLIARIYGNAKKLDQSLALLDSCEVYYRKNNDTHWLGRIKLFRMSALATSEEWEAAVKVGKEAREFLEEHGGATDQKMILEDLHTAYAATGRFEEAYEAFTAFKIFADSVDMQSFDAQSDVQMQRLELQVERLKSQQLESQHAAERVKWQMLVGGLILLLLTGGLVVYGQSRFQRQAKAYQSRLEGDVLARTRALEQANMELKRTNFDLERFAYVASHDLREPIHNILNFVDLINRDKDQLPPRYQAYLGFMASSALNMHKLVKELMVFSQLKARKSQWVDVDLGQIMSEVIYEIEKKAPRPIEVEVTSLPVIRAYGPHFSMIFHRLLDNAITYNQAPVPQIKVDYVPEATHYRFRVLDNGIGIAPEYQERVFEIFARLHTREEYPGTGIALASCKRIVEFYGGEMGVESQAGKGARFYFTIARQMVDLPDATVLTPEV
ncbi:MAG: ATP-binding protein, partial [Bacteroidota bacterium]